MFVSESYKTSAAGWRTFSGSEIFSGFYIVENSETLFHAQNLYL